jgi:hypothetical protein
MKFVDGTVLRVHPDLVKAIYNMGGDDWESSRFEVGSPTFRRRERRLQRLAIEIGYVGPVFEVVE